MRRHDDIYIVWLITEEAQIVLMRNQIVTLYYVLKDNDTIKY